MYSHKGKIDFDDFNNKIQHINLSEILKMLKDHLVYPQLIEKYEVASLVRLINMNTN